MNIQEVWETENGALFGEEVDVADDFVSEAEPDAVFDADGDPEVLEVDPPLLFTRKLNVRNGCLIGKQEQPTR